MLICDYIVESIDGDYAHLRRTDLPEEELKLVARALLPFDITEGCRLHYEMIRLYSGDPMRIQHFCKVHSYAKLIAEMEHVDASTLFVLEAAALTHDIGIHLCEEKYGSSNGKLQEKEGPAIAEKLLKELQFEENVIERVKYLIAHHHTYDAIDGIDYQIMIEADYLVNADESNFSGNNVRNMLEKVFKTETGKFLLQSMYQKRLNAEE